jgi:hypothetical protein
MDSFMNFDHALSMNTVEEISLLLSRKARALVEQSYDQLNEILDDSFVYVNSQGKKSSKAEYIKLCTSGALNFQSQKFENLEIQDFGSFALATMILHDEFEYSGESYKGIFRSFCVFRKTNSKWYWAGGQTSEEIL